jgi:Fur family peroxide stress response transcriptional regulator
MENIVERCRKKGLKLTPQRIAILKYLKGNTTHPTAEAIYRKIKRVNPSVSFATVYNTVEALVNIGEMQKLTIDPKRLHYDPNPSPHHHIVCTECGKIGDVFVDYTAFLALPREITKDFTATGNHVDFYGVCKGCKG